MSERIKIRYHEGKGNVSDAWTVLIDDKEIGAFFIQVSEPNPLGDREKKISFYFNSVGSGFYAHELIHSPQDSRFTLIKTLHKWDSELGENHEC